MAARLLLSPAVVILLLGSPQQARAAPTGRSPVSGDTEALQVLADLTLIDGACTNDKVNFGVVFRFTAQKGVPAVTMMPMGIRRIEFETVMRARRASFDRDELCGEIAANYAEALPGSVNVQPVTGDRP